MKKCWIVTIILTVTSTFSLSQELNDSTLYIPQNDSFDTITISNDTIFVTDSISSKLDINDSLIIFDINKFSDSLELISQIDSDSLASLLLIDKKLQKKASKRDWATWRPNPQHALWLALVLPGAGQIYNRKYWKLPIFYGGIMGCLYSMNWNNMMYMDYSQAYLDIMDDDPTTESYNSFMHLGNKIDSSNESRYKTLFKKRKDKYRRWRDLGFFCLIGVYALSVIDAYVDAELSDFDITKDLSVKVEPTIIENNKGNNTLENAAIGFQCSLNF